MISYEPYRDARLPALVEFWNDGPAKSRNGWRVKPADLRARIIDKRTGIESFDPAGFILAVEGPGVIGVIHAAVQPEALANVLAPGWPGGTRGAVLFLYVRPAFRRRGIGTALWTRAADYLRACRETIVDGACMNPYYGNSEGPFTPFFGTPEGIAATWDDDATKNFFSKRGFPARHRAVQYARELTNVPPTDESIRVIPATLPELGAALDSPSRVEPRHIFETAIAFDGPTVAGTLCFYPMLEARQGLFGIYELRVAESHRGRGLGRGLLSSALARMAECAGQSCEVLTMPDVSPEAAKLYESFGFAPAAEWAIF